MCESLLIETITGAIDLSVAFRFLKPVNVRKVESCLLIEDELSLDGGLADYVWVSRAFCKVTFYDVRYSSRHNFNWMCFYEIFVSCCQSLRRVYARNIAAKSTCRLAYECGALSSLNGATSSFFWQVSIFTECTVGKVAPIEPSLSFDDLYWRRSHDFIGSVGSKQWECTFGDACERWSTIS